MNKINTTSNTAQLKTPLECLSVNAYSTPDRVFLTQPKDGEVLTWSWLKVKQDAIKLANALRNEGIGKADRVIIWSKNCAEWIISDFAIQMLGAISVPLYPGQGNDSSKYVMEHSGAKLIIVGKQDDYPAVERILSDCSIPRVAMDYYTGACELTWHECMSHSDDFDIEYPHLDDLMTIVYTSGTTGNPKGVMHSYRTYGATCQMFKETFDLEVNIPSSQQRFFSFLPLAHMAERIIVQGNAIYFGAPIFFAESLETFISDVQRARPSVFFAIPRIWEKLREQILAKISEEKLELLLKLPIVSSLIKKKIKKSLGLDNVRIIGCGAAPISPKTLNWYDSLGMPILEGYGMTENSCYGTFNLPSKRQITSVGYALPDCEIKLSDTDNEVLLRSPGLMLGYYHDVEATDGAFDKDGFYRSGDRGLIDDQGYLHIVGRLREQFKSSKGKFIVPTNIEKLIISHPLIEQVCVIGSGMTQPVLIAQLSETAQEYSDEELMAVLTRCIEESNTQLEHHEILSSAWFTRKEWNVDNKLMTPTLKVKRHEVELCYRGYIEDQKSPRLSNMLPDFLLEMDAKAINKVAV